MSRSLHRTSERVELILKMAIKCTHKLKRVVHIHNYICNVLKEMQVLQDSKRIVLKFQVGLGLSLKPVNCLLVARYFS